MSNLNYNRKKEEVIVENSKNKIKIVKKLE